VSVQEGDDRFFVRRFEFTKQFSFERIGDATDRLDGFVALQIREECLQGLPGQAGNGMLADVAGHYDSYGEWALITQCFFRWVAAMTARR
jgi:hypothetical protein